MSSVVSKKFIVVPWIGMVALWWAEGQFLLAGAAVVGTLVMLHASSWAFDPNGDPWSVEHRPVGGGGVDVRPHVDRPESLPTPTPIGYLVAPDHTAQLLARIRS